MCGIAGFCGFGVDFQRDAEKWNRVLVNMREAVGRRGPDGAGEYLKSHVGLSHTRLAVRDIDGGVQPMIREVREVRGVREVTEVTEVRGVRSVKDGEVSGEYAIVYNGELYNSDELKAELVRAGYDFVTTSDTEVILNAFIHYGAGFAARLNGIFAFAVWEQDRERLYLFRDHLGVKPLFYTVKDGVLVFGSEHKALFAHPDVTPVIDTDSFREVFGVGPAKTPGNGVFKGINELLPGHYAVFSAKGFKTFRYWSLCSRLHTDSYEDTVANVRFLVTDAIKRQLVSDVPICSMLSGGVDSSIITAVAGDLLVQGGFALNTFSFDFKGNDEHFTANAFQPERDRPFVDKMLAQYPLLNHTYLECAEEDLIDYLYLSTDSKDLPGMADIDASLLYFCGVVGRHNKVALTGECADEIFGGYPWFYREELLNADGFPWSKDMEARTMLLSPDFRNELKLEEHSRERYRESLRGVPALQGETVEEARRREVAYLNIQWFMQTLLTRMDRASMYMGLEARVPFADYRIAEYLWNVPWGYKCRNGVVKGLLRDAFRELLPPELLNRKKSPYPKTYNPNYTRLLSQRLLDIVNNPSSPIVPLLDRERVLAFIKTPQTQVRPWFGQLMAGPQLMAYLIQVNYWLGKYNY